MSLAVAGAGDLLERAEALAALERHLAAVTTSAAGRLVFIGGEAGVGKTSLVRRFCANQSVRVLSGACDALATPHPLGPLLDIAHRSAGDLEALIIRGARPHEVAGALLDQLSSGPPHVVVLEDLHWADDATLDVLRLLARKVESAPVLMIGTYRDDQIDRGHPLRMLIGDIATSPAVARLSLSPLSKSAVAELASPYGLDAAELYRNTGGNPFFVTEVLAAGGDTLPATVQDAVLARVARLGPVAQRLVETVAVIPADVDIGVVEAMDAEAVGGVDECLAAGVLAAISGGVAFRHELARLAVELSLSPPRRVSLHRAALAALSDPTRGPIDPTSLSHHAEGAGDVDAVLRFAPEAAEVAAQAQAHREAAAQYARALRFGWALTDERRAELLSQRSWECFLVGHYADAIEARKKALATYRLLGDTLREGDALRAMSSNLRCFGQVAEASEAGVAAVAVLEQLPAGHELALAYANRAMLALNIEDTAATRFWGGKALELAERLDDRETLVHAMNSIGTAGYLLGDDDGRRALERSLQLCREWGFAEQAGRAYIHLAWAGVRVHDYARAEIHQREGLEYCLERGLDAWRFEILAHQARRLVDQGRWEQATEATSTVLRSGTANAVAQTLVLCIVAVLRARRGDPDHRGPLAEAQANAAPTGELQHLLPVATASAEVAWLEGGGKAADAARAATDDAMELAMRFKAAAAVSELAAWRRRCGIREAGPAEVVGPYALELAGDTAGAAAAWTELGCRYEAAVTLCVGGSDEHHRRAIAIFQALDARPAAAIAARLLREGGALSVPRGPRPSTKQNAGGLTTRELEVLGMLSEEMSNRDIARRLHLSEKTVDHHVAAILAKLGVSNRRQAARAAAPLVSR
ncbi:MAG TPA: AAA family ATPase [Candidatus Acidoferrales bacterium]|nr:AAA family ATPase [Candidatus Acidoferrales bacterium]